MGDAHTEMNVSMNSISELTDGVFYSVLDFCDSMLLEKLLDPSVGYVWSLGYNYGNFTWHSQKMPLERGVEPRSVFTRNATFDFILPTWDFLEFLPRLPKQQHIVQMNKMPPDYADLAVIKGKQRFALLDRLEWAFEFETQRWLAKRSQSELIFS